MSARYVATIKRHGRLYHYHRRAGFHLAPVSAGVDVDDQAAVDADFKAKCADYMRPDDPRAKAAALARTARSKPFRKAINRARERARAADRPCEITMETIDDLYRQQRGRCALSGMRFDISPGRFARANPFRPSIDRIDCAKGYTPDNIRLVLIAVNYGRADFDDAAYIEICRAVARTSRERCKPFSPSHDLAKTEGSK